MYAEYPTHLMTGRVEELPPPPPKVSMCLHERSLFIITPQFNNFGLVRFAEGYHKNSRRERRCPRGNNYHGVTKDPKPSGRHVYLRTFSFASARTGSSAPSCLEHSCSRSRNVGRDPPLFSTCPGPRGPRFPPVDEPRLCPNLIGILKTLLAIRSGAGVSNATTKFRDTMRSTRAERFVIFERIGDVVRGSRLSGIAYGLVYFVVH